MATGCAIETRVDFRRVNGRVKLFTYKFYLTYEYIVTNYKTRSRQISSMYIFKVHTSTSISMSSSSSEAVFSLFALSFPNFLDESFWESRFDKAALSLSFVCRHFIRRFWNHTFTCRDDTTSFQFLSDFFFFLFSFVFCNLKLYLCIRKAKSGGKLPSVRFRDVLLQGKSPLQSLSLQGTEHSSRPRPLSSGIGFWLIGGCRGSRRYRNCKCLIIKKKKNKVENRNTLEISK